MKEIDNFYLQLDEPNKSCLLALRDIILSQDQEISAEWKYNLPFFCYKGKMFCYLWIRPKTNQPYLGIVEGKYFDHPALLAEKRSRIKIMLFEPNEDLPIETIEMIIQQAINLYKSGQIKLRDKKR
ncbi:hypothetical protein EMA8858_02536 [Emticicia aquatica]|jgi:hypothetical protein|uniref:YdhG-like domain-containing protein n=1 Tax=Emticicia aquatica TaxID=1681835 RepID=A0ABN8ETN8_9BACT|nr:DUF1801 domain-containing protein [Emticicia aquatica]CAH0996404.1 hypothetical protein EMA8858_02536 [Emticicia aquatica]